LNFLSVAEILYLQFKTIMLYNMKKSTNFTFCLPTNISSFSANAASYYL